MSALSERRRAAERWLPLVSWLALASLTVLSTRHAQADEPKAAPQTPPAASATDRCVASFDAAQKQRLAGRLLAARHELVMCAQPACPEVVSGKCVQWLEQINAAIPSLVVAARDQRGHDLIDAKLFIDGALVSEQMDGAAIELDVGAHTIEVRHAGRRSQQQVLVREGEQRRRIDVVVGDDAAHPKPGPASKRPPAPKKPAAPKPPARTTPNEPLVLPTVSWVGFSAGAVGLLLGTASGIAAVVIGDDLQSRCEQGICHPPEQEDLRAGTVLAHASTVSFIVAAAGTAAGVVALVIAEDDGSHAAGAPQRPRLAVRLAPARISLEGRF